MGEPHWLIQELTGEAIGTAVVLGGAWILRKRTAIADRLRGRTPVLLSGTLDGGSSWAGELSVGFDEVAILNATVSGHYRSTYNPFTGKWVTTRIPFE